MEGLVGSKNFVSRIEDLSEANIPYFSAGLYKGRRKNSEKLA